MSSSEPSSGPSSGIRPTGTRTADQAAAAPEPLDWDAFTERAVPTGLGETVSPEAELAGLLQRRQDDIGAARGVGAESTAKAQETLFELASLLGSLERVVQRAEGPMAESGHKRLHRQLRVLKDQMFQALADDEVEVRDPVGQPADAVADWVDPVGWRQGPQYTSEVVAQTDEPAVFHRGAVVRFARVIMGAPEPEPPRAAEPPGAPEAEAAGEHADGRAPEAPADNGPQAADPAADQATAGGASGADDVSDAADAHEADDADDAADANEANRAADAVDADNDAADNAADNAETGGNA
ncbi:hypothetical protein [Streptomyces sp. NPDC050560]|uniref:hypothetical protein n=1 Tax=Streptomyces sp. NPDC050560 TaxID=3365630 RepID=UPI00378D2CE8